MTTKTSTEALPNLYGKDGARRPDVERRLNANVQRGSLFSAELNADRVTYRIVTSGGTELAKVSLPEASMVCSVATSAFNEGRADQDVDSRNACLSCDGTGVER